MGTSSASIDSSRPRGPYGIAKGRFQPGFEKHLSGASVLLAYAALALGFASLELRATLRQVRELPHSGTDTRDARNSPKTKVNTS